MNFSIVSPHSSNSDPLYSFSYREQNSFEIKSLQQIILTDDHMSTLVCKVIWIKTGSGLIKVNEQVYTVCDNTIYCVPPGKACRIIPGSTSIDGYNISFAPFFLQYNSIYGHSAELPDLFNNSYALQVFSVTDNMHEELELTANILLSEYTGRFNRRGDLLCRLLSVFIIYFTRHTELKKDHDKISSDGFQYRQFISLVKKNFITKKLVSDYANDLCITPNYLNRIVKKISGFSASYHIQQQVIAEAKKQAIYCGCNMKAIAYNLGFDNTAHFSKYFKKNTGVSFSSFRKSFSLAKV